MTQAYQAALLQLQIEDLRRLKYSPTGGFSQFSLADPLPAVSWSVLDHERVPKRGYFAVRDACRPVLPMVEPRAGLVHVVNDTRTDVAGAVLEVSVDGRVTRWTGDIPADGIAFVGRVELADAVDVEVVLEHRDTGRVLEPLSAPRPASRDAGAGDLRTRTIRLRPVEPGLDSVSRSHERPEPPRRGVSDGNDDDTATRCCPHSEGAAGRPGARPVLPIGDRQEVGHGASPASCSWGSSSST